MKIFSVQSFRYNNTAVVTILNDMVENRIRTYIVYFLCKPNLKLMQYYNLDNFLPI